MFRLLSAGLRLRVASVSENEHVVDGDDNDCLGDEDECEPYTGE